MEKKEKEEEEEEEQFKPKLATNFDDTAPGNIHFYFDEHGEKHFYVFYDPDQGEMDEDRFREILQEVDQTENNVNVIVRPPPTSIPTINKVNRKTEVGINLDPPKEKNLPILKIFSKSIPLEFSRLQVKILKVYHIDNKI